MIEISNILDVKNCLKGIKVAAFDLDDTLYSEKDYVKSGYKAVASEFPHIKDMALKLWNVFEKGGKAFDEVLKNENVYSEDMKAKCLKIYRFHKPSISLYSGVRDMLLGLKNKGTRLALVTDGRPEGQWAKIEALKIKGLFDRIIITDELGGIEFRKPCSKAFVELRKEFNVKYKDMVYVGDNIVKDFIAPNAIGMKVIYFRNKNGLY